jgi:hypothetical protein
MSIAVGLDHGEYLCVSAYGGLHRVQVVREARGGDLYPALHLFDYRLGREGVVGKE